MLKLKRLIGIKLICKICLILKSVTCSVPASQMYEHYTRYIWTLNSFINSAESQEGDIFKEEGSNLRQQKT